MSKKSDIIFMARIAEKAERYNEMKEYMHQVASTPDPETGKVDLTSEERNLLSIAYKNVVNNKRVSWRILSQHSQKENAPYLQDIIEFMNKVEKELKDVCQEILSLLEDYLIPGAKDGSQKVFYWKLKGDYYRYVCEFEKDEKKDETKTKAREAYRRPWILVRRSTWNPLIPSCWAWHSTFPSSTTRLKRTRRRRATSPEKPTTERLLDSSLSLRMTIRTQLSSCSFCVIT